MKINYNKRTIELTKAEYKKATVYNSDEYKALKDAKSDSPTFKIIIKAAPKRKNQFSSLTYDYMRKYIETHDKDCIEDFERITAQSEDTKGLSVYRYGEVKKWFLDKYPEIKNFCEKKSA